SKPSTIVRRPWRFNSDRIAAIAARYILRLTFCAKLRGLAAKVTPPPTKIGAVSAPWRAPPPFCFFDFLVVPLTSARVFCALVPARPALRYATTTWWTRSSLNSRPNTASDTDSVLLLPLMASSIVISPYALLEGRTTTSPAGAPGTAPLIAIMQCYASTMNTCRRCVVCVSAPMWPDFFLPGNTQPGVWRWPIDQGERCDSELPWVASPMLKFQ